VSRPASQPEGSSSAAQSAEVAASTGSSAAQVSFGHLLESYGTAIYHYAEQHLGLIGVILYAYVSAIGLLYSQSLYWVIGINPLDFFETSDFLLAGLRHPIALVLPAVIFISDAAFSLLLFLPVLSMTPLWKKAGVPDRLVDRFRRLNQILFHLQLGYAIVATVMFTLMMPVLAAAMVDQCARPVLVHLRKEAAGDEKSAPPLARAIVGSTQKFLFLENPADKTYSAMPIDIVSQVVPDAPSKRSLPERLACLAIQ
jgi:hypothetical protein